MRLGRLDDMKGGWMIGAFTPTCHSTDACEVAVKKYDIGTREARHVHKIATEVTLILSGRVEMNGQVFISGDVIVLDPGESTDFMALENTVTVCVKTPCVVGDKYIL